MLVHERLQASTVWGKIATTPKYVNINVAIMRPACAHLSERVFNQLELSLYIHFTLPCLTPSPLNSKRWYFLDLLE